MWVVEYLLLLAGGGRGEIYIYFLYRFKTHPYFESAKNKLNKKYESRNSTFLLQFESLFVLFLFACLFCFVLFCPPEMKILKTDLISREESLENEGKKKASKMLVESYIMFRNWSYFNRREIGIQIISIPIVAESCLVLIHMCSECSLRLVGKLSLGKDSR